MSYSPLGWLHESLIMREEASEDNVMRLLDEALARQPHAYRTYRQILERAAREPERGYSKRSCVPEGIHPRKEL